MFDVSLIKDSSTVITTLSFEIYVVNQDNNVNLHTLERILVFSIILLILGAAIKKKNQI